MINTPFDTMIRGVCEAATNASTGFEKLRLDSFIPSTKRRQRKYQAEQFAFEEAQLHEQLMIEQDILERQMREQRQVYQIAERNTVDTPERDSATQPTAQSTIEEPVAPVSNDPVLSEDRIKTVEDSNVEQNAEPAGPVRLVPAPKNSHKVEAIERKLSLIRQRLAAPSKKNDAGIASLRAAIAC